MKKLFLAIAAVAMVFATSCQKESTNAPEEPAVAGENEFVCVIDQNASQQNAPAVNDDMGTLAHIDASNNVWWQEGDQIAYYGTENTDGVGRYVLTCSKLSDNSAYFSAEGKHFYQGAHEAYYPADIMNLDGQGQKVLTLQPIINLEAGKNAGQLPMYGTNTEGKGGQHYLTFHNICAVLKIAIPSTITACNQIVLSATEPIAGPFTMNGTKAVLANSGTSTTLTVNAPSGTTFSGTVYVAIPENTTNGGYHNFTVKYFDGTTYLGEKTNPNAMSVEAGKIYPVTVSHLCVNLGLSVKWATCNLGATNPWDYGDYYAWGETEPYYTGSASNPTWKTGKSDGYYWPSYSFGSLVGENWTEGNTKPYNASTKVLFSNYDAAQANWCGNWRMPTKEEFEELSNTNNCEWTWTTDYNSTGIAGYVVKSKKTGYTNNSIFLPAAHHFILTSLYDYTSNGVNYRTATRHNEYNSCAYTLFFYASDHWMTHQNHCVGYPVRPVCQ